MKQKIIPILSILVGILAFVLTSEYLKSRNRELRELEERIYAGARKIYVVAAATDIPAGTTIKPGDIGKLPVFEASAPDRVITEEQASSIIGRKTLFEIPAKKPILWSDIEGGAPGAVGLSPIIQPRMRALSLAVAGADSVSGMVQPNDKVDVLGTFSFPSKSAPGQMETVTLTVLQDVTVLATGQRLAKQEVSERTAPRSSGYTTVTLEVTPREAELLVFAQQARGRLTLTLRNSSDVYYESDLPEINFEHLEKKLPDLNLYRQREIRHNPIPAKPNS
jgi:pilus assembly protein CpaB